MLSNKYRVNVRKARLSLKRLKIFYIFLNRIIIVQLVIGNCYCARYFRIVATIYENRFYQRVVRFDRNIAGKPAVPILFLIRSQ